MTRVLVCGGRDFDYQKVVSYILDKLYDEEDCQWDTLIYGVCRGADICAARWTNSVPVTTDAYPADWKKYGKAAGFIRNKQMLVEGKPDLVIAFPGGAGTESMVGLAEEAGIRVIDYG